MPNNISSCVVLDTPELCTVQCSSVNKLSVFVIQGSVGLGWNRNEIGTTVGRKAH